MSFVIDRSHNVEIKSATTKISPMMVITLESVLLVDGFCPIIFMRRIDFCKYSSYAIAIKVDEELQKYNT